MCDQLSLVLLLWLEYRSRELTLEVGQEKVDDLVLLDRKREQVNFFDRFDLAVLDQSTKFSDRDPDE
jgi:hypothetical protein